MKRSIREVKLQLLLLLQDAEHRPTWVMNSLRINYSIYKEVRDRLLNESLIEESQDGKRVWLKLTEGGRHLVTICLEAKLIDLEMLKTDLQPSVRDSE